MSGASPWLQYRVGKWVANHRSTPDPDGRVYDAYNDEPGTPLFHFGHGLSYTSFAMSQLAVQPTAATLNGHTSTSLQVELVLTNTGTRAGAEVVQVYIVDPVSEYVRPWKRLLTFRRVHLDAGQSARVSLLATPEMLAFQDDSSAVGEWVVVPGEYQIRVGPSSIDDTLTADVLIS